MTILENNQIIRNVPGSDELKEALRHLTTSQIRYCIARIDSRTDKEAAETIGLSPVTIKGWNNKAEVDQVVSLMRYDGMITALELRRRSLAEAMAVKVNGLRSLSDKIQQDAATELIEWEMGKAMQKQETNLKGTINLIWDLPKPTSD